MSDQQFQKWLDDIQKAIDGDTEAKEDLDHAVYQARRELEQRGHLIEDLANERNRYRNSVFRVKNGLEKVLEEDADSLGRLENEVKELYTELDDLDIEPDESTYGKGIFNVFDSDDGRTRRGAIRDILAAVTFLGVGYGANESRKASNQADTSVPAKSEPATPEYQSDTFELDSGEFQDVFEDLPEIYQNDILPGGTESDQYQAWVGDDDYEELLGAVFFYNEDPSKKSSMMYEHSFGEDETQTRETLENDQTAEELYNEVLE